MPNPSFVHLRLHSEYSIADGTVRIDDVVKAAAADGQGALALTDLANTFGLIKFYQQARSAGVKPIAGCDVWITNPADRERPTRLLLLVANQRGYLNLCELLTQAWLTNQYRGRAEVLPEWIEGGLGEGLLALSGGPAGDVGAAFAAGNAEQARRAALRWAELFPRRFYLEIQRVDQPGSEALVQQTVALAADTGLPVVATHPVQFLTPDDFTAHEARVCISEGDMLANPRRPKKFTPDQYFLTQAEMAARFADLPVALANSVEIAKRCSLTLELGKPKLPLFPTDGMTLDEFLVDRSKDGLEKRLLQLYPNQAERDAQRATYYQRLEFECGTIIKMGFPGYFLIVADFINWAKNNGVPVGPGRGSGAGSLVAYALGITDLDPLRYNLLFERFLNPERVSMPDFDIDFCQHGRDRVIQYVKEKYGADAVSQIATFGTMAAKAAVRDIGRVLDLGYNFTDGVAKLIPFKPGKHVTIADAMKEEPLLQERFDNEDEVHQLLELAQRVEGLTRNVGMHAGGVLIAPGKLTDFCPLYNQSASEDGGGVISQYDKDDVEAVGLVKFDFLGLTTLTILDWAERYIRRLDPTKENWSLAQVPLTDPASFQILKKANTVAVFQLESRGMQGMLKDAQPDRFEDIIALVALYRPGPMDLIPSFCARKHGREVVEYPDPRVEPVLKETYGIMVYQEQVMQMAQIIGNYSLGGADLLRRAMGKKKPEEMAKHRELFREGAAVNGLTAEKADEIFDLMEKFAGYGFNKSHAAAYALLAYYTAWLKAHHPAEFMAANMSLAMDDTDKVKILFEDCLNNGLAVLPPDINLSAYRFEPVAHPSAAADLAAGKPPKRSDTIRYGLGAIKGSGQSAIEEILRAREDGPFVDLFDFCQRVDRRIVNRRTIEALIRAGAFDSLHRNRAALLASVSLAIEAAEQASANALQAGLFDMPDGTAESHDLVAEPEWTDKRRLQEEKGALGFYLSGHLFDAYSGEVRRFVRQKLGELKEGRDKLVAGIITSLRTQMTQRGKMLIVLLDDGSGQCEVTIFNEQFEANKHLFKEDELLVVRGQARYDSFSGGLRFTADSVMDLERARRHFADALLLSLNGNANAARLREVLQPHCAPAPAASAAASGGDAAAVGNGHGKGGGAGNGGQGNGRGQHERRGEMPEPAGLRVRIRYRSNGVECDSELGERWRVKPSDELLAQLKQAFAGEAVEISYGGR
jgi:DNA polymerase-3 subunit alpha